MEILTFCLKPLPLPPPFSPTHTKEGKNKVLVGRSIPFTSIEAKQWLFKECLECFGSSANKLFVLY